MDTARCEGELVSAYLDGELPGSEAASVGEHIRRCQVCAAEFEEMSLVRRALSALPDTVARPGHKQRMFRRIAADLIAWSGAAGMGVACAWVAATLVALLASSLPLWYRVCCAAGFALVGIGILPILYHNFRGLVSLRRARGRWDAT